MQYQGIISMHRQVMKLSPGYLNPFNYKCRKMIQMTETEREILDKDVAVFVSKYERQIEQLKDLVDQKDNDKEKVIGSGKNNEDLMNFDDDQWETIEPSKSK